MINWNVTYCNIIEVLSQVSWFFRNNHDTISRDKEVYGMIPGNCSRRWKVWDIKCSKYQECFFL